MRDSKRNINCLFKYSTEISLERFEATLWQAWRCVSSFIARKNDKAGKRFGFVGFSNRNDADRATFRLNGFWIFGYRLTVKEARYRDKRPGRKFYTASGSKAGEVDENAVCKLKKCLVGTMATICSSSQVKDRLRAGGLGEIRIKFLGWRDFLVEIDDDELHRILKESNWSYLKEVFIDVQYWIESYRSPQRITWIKLYGVPLHCWNHVSFKRIAERWGEFVAMGENALKTSSEEDTTEKRFGEDEVQLCCMGNLSGGGFLSGEDLGERNIGEEIIMGLRTYEVDIGKVQRKINGEAENVEKADVNDRRIMEDIMGIGLKSNCAKDSNKMEEDLEEGMITDRPIVKPNLKDAGEDRETKKEVFNEVEIGCMWSDDDFEFRFSKAIGKSGGLLSIWDKNRFKVESSIINDRFILISGNYTVDNSSVSIVNVYAPCEGRDQYTLWNAIELEKRRDMNRWFMAGDFNTVRNRSERSGCHFNKMEIEAFNKFIENCNLLDMPLAGRKFTWFGPSNRRSRLDRIFVEDDWLQENCEVSLWGLPRTVSDHIPIVLDNEVKEMEKRINELDRKGEITGLDDHERKEVVECTRRLWELLKEKEEIWRHKSRLKWLKLGDENSAFFHRAVKLRSKKSNHFQRRRKQWNTVLKLPFKRVSISDVEEMEALIIIEEIKEAVWSCDESKAPGPDGFNILFFKKSWEWLKGDLLKTVERFLKFGKLGKNVNNSFLALIPKVDSPSEIAEYRPISLVSCLYKIITKVLAGRLKRVIGKVISETQCAFLAGRQIFDGILVANEVIHSLYKEPDARGGLILKLDFAKAYDCVCWEFLDSVQQGLRQGDPLSPFLFLMVTETLHLMLEGAVSKGYIEGIHNVAPNTIISHLQFADDTILFLWPDQDGLRNVKRILRCFELGSGLTINFTKSCLVGVGMEEDSVRQLAAVRGCTVSRLPFKYLGIPMGVDPRRVSVWDPVIDKCRTKLSRWKSIFLSFVGRIVLINSVLSSLPLYYMSLYSVPKTVLWKIDKIRRDFLWGSYGSGRKMSRINWGKMCKPKMKRGAGIIDLGAKNKALLAKWGWRFANEKDALWRSVISFKYGSDKIPWMVSTDKIKEASIIWRGIINNLRSEELSKWMSFDSFRWQVGDGKTMWFWEDVWLGEKSFMNRFPRIYRLVSRKFRTIFEVLRESEWRDSSVLFVRQLLDRERNIFNVIKGEIGEAQIKPDVVDRIIWIHEKDGKFSVKKMTELLLGNDNIIEADQPKYDKIWSLKVPPKVKCFLWMLKQNRVPTKAFLKSRGIKLNEHQCLCPWCGDVEEDADHLFVSCRYMAFFWMSFCRWWQIEGCSMSTVDEMFEFGFQVRWSVPRLLAWQVSFAAALWSIWLVRNEFVFREKRAKLKDVVCIVKMRALVWCKTLKEFNELDEKRWWACPGFCVDSCEEKRRQKLIWQPPGLGKMKFNVDGSANKEAAGCGGVLRNSEGHVVAMFFGPVSLVNVDFAELVAIKFTLELFCGSKWLRNVVLIIESDSAVVLNWLQSYSGRPWKWGSTFEEIDGMFGCNIPQLWSTLFPHIVEKCSSLTESVGQSIVNKCYCHHTRSVVVDSSAMHHATLDAANVEYRFDYNSPSKLVVGNGAPLNVNMASLPIRYWSYVAQTAIHLVNRLPMKLLQNVSPQTGVQWDEDKVDNSVVQGTLKVQMQPLKMVTDVNKFNQLLLLTICTNNSVPIEEVVSSSHGEDSNIPSGYQSNEARSETVVELSEEPMVNDNHHSMLTRILDKLDALQQNNTWEIVKLPEGRKVVGCKKIFKLKCNIDGSMHRHKTRLVVKGYTQIPSQDFR
ncbi:hypothetical protein F3Y22_tig00006886pilonHSYRG00006 [Hibiscus syriacus]|uniref:Reverse transcriptase domain-containing protein n=1 Tax=Hibiscus syriacus TaxID=106335 RepID=A0A6A3CCW5_HIBSY|nr:hypothetical protein F3Y22_tig00006886pilonHSYRG00006 [Hibiscus syriacus]